MSAGTLNITIEQGADFIRLLTIKDDVGTPINLTGYTFKSDLKDQTCGDVVASFSFVLANQGTNPGEVTWSMSAAITSGIEAQCVVAGDGTFTTTPYLYDIEMTMPSGEIDRIMRGNCNVSPEVTTS